MSAASSRGPSNVAATERPGRPPTSTWTIRSCLTLLASAGIAGHATRKEGKSAIKHRSHKVSYGDVYVWIQEATPRQVLRSRRRLQWSYTPI